VKITITRPRRKRFARADARAIATRVGGAVAGELRQALTAGYYADSGKLRPKTDAAHKGYRTGHLARGIQAGPPQGSPTRATTTITVPADRRGYVEQAGDVLVLEGRVDALIEAELEAIAGKVASS
jgi:hypothetical protein